MKTTPRKNANLLSGRALLVFGAISFLCASARAANDSWSGAAGNANWNANNWAGGNAIPVSGDSLIFGATTGGFTSLSDNLMTPGSFNVAGITFASNAALFTIAPATAGTNGFTLTGSIADNSTTNLETIGDLITISGTQAISTVPGGNLYLSGIISGTQIIATGGGNLILGGANTFSGDLIVESGTVTGTASGNAFGATASPIVLGDANTTAAGATLIGASGVTYTSPIIVSAAALSNPLTITNISSISPTFSGNLTLNNTLVVTAVGSTGKITLTGSVTGTGNLVTNGTSGGFVSVQLTGVGLNWTGNLIVNSGSATTSSNQGLGDSNTIQVNSGAVFIATSGWNLPAGGVTGSGSVNIQNNFAFGGSGSYAFSGTYNQSGGTFFHYNTGTQTFSGVVTLPGAQVNNGELILSSANGGSLTETNNLTIGNGNALVTTGSETTGQATVLIAGNYTINLSNGNSVNVQDGSLSSNKSGGTLSLADGTINTLSIIVPAADTNKTILQFQGATGAPSGLVFDVGNNTSDQINGNGQTGEKLSSPGAVNQLSVILNGIGGITAGGSSFLINFPGDSGFNSTSPFFIASTTGNFSGFTTVSLAETTNSLQVTWSNQTATPVTAYWDNAAPSSSGTWATLTGGTNNYSNWSSSSSGTVNTLQIPGSSTNVVFNGENSTLNASVSINAVTASGTNFSITSGSFLSGAGAVTISGTNTLTVGSGGLTVSSGSNDTISANVALGSPQTWTATSGTLSVTGSLSSNNALTVAGPGTVVLGGNNANFTGGLTINSGTVILSNTGALNGPTPNAVDLAVAASSTGYLNLNGNNVTVSGLSTNSNSGTAVIQNANVSTTGILTVSQSGSSVFSGTLQDGAGSASLGLTLASGTLTLTAANTYSGATTVNGGLLNIYGSLGSSSNVAVNSGGILSGTGGTVHGAVTVNSGGEIMPGIVNASGTSIGTLTLSNGLTINSGGIAAFNFLPNGSTNDEIEITGALTIPSGAILEVSTGTFATGSYALMTFSSISNASLAGVVEDNLQGQALGSNYSFVVVSGTLDLVVAPSAAANPGITINIPAANTRVMENTSVVISGSILNSGTVNSLNGTLSNTGGLAVNLPSSTFTVAEQSGTAYSGTIPSTGATLGSNTVSVTVTDSNASPTSQTATGTVDVLANRTVTASSTNFGLVHLGSNLSTTLTLSSPGADNQNTRVTVADSSAPDTNGISVTGGNPTTGTFNGSFTDTRNIGGPISTLGVVNGSITLTTTGEGLVNESPNNVSVAYSGTVFSGTAAWAVNSSNSWATNGNWVDTQQAGGIPGAPGLAGSASTGDVAIFNNVSGQSGILTVSLNGANPTLAGITFNSSFGYAIVPGTGGQITLQGAATPISVTTGSDTISAILTGNGLNKLGSGTLAISGANTYTGSTQVSNGVLQVTGASLPVSTILTLGDNSNDSGQLVLGNSSTLQGATIAGLQTLGTGASNSIVGGGNSGTATLQITGNSGISYTYGGVLGGAGSNQNNINVNLTGSFTQIFTGTSTYTAPTETGSGNTNSTLGIDANETFSSGTILTGGAIGTGVLDFNNTGTIIAVGGTRSIDNVIILTGGGSSIVAGSNALIFNQTAGYFAVAGGNQALSNDDSGGLTLAGPVYLDGTATTTGSSQLILTGSYATTISGSIGAYPGSAAGTATTGLLLNSTTEELILSGSLSTFTGSTEVSSGTLEIAAPDTVVSGNVTSGPIGQSILNLKGGTVMAPANTPETVDSPTFISASSTIGGGGNLTLNGVISSSGPFILTIVGPGQTIFTKADTYTGTTNISSGNLVVNGSVTSPVNVNPNSGYSTLSGTGSISGAVITTATSGNIPHIAPGANTTGNFGGNFGGVGTLTMNGGLTLANGTELDFDLGTSSDLIAVNGQLTLGTNVVLDINPVSGFVTSGSKTYNLITYSGALTGSTTGWVVSDEPAATTSSFSIVSGTVMVTIASTASPGVAYWSGAQGSGGNGTWNTITSNASTNWLTAINGGVDTNQVPYGGLSNVFFIADSGSNTNTYLGTATTINSLNFTGVDSTVTTGSAVTISGSIPGSGTNNSLTINATGTNGNTAGSGITTGIGAGADTINAPLVLGGNQTWTLNASPSSPLTVSGTISGAHALTLAGTGELVLGGNNTFTGGLTINGSVNVVLNNTGALNSTAPDSVTFGPSSSGTLNLSGFSVAIGSLSSTTGTPVIQNNSSTPAVLTIGQTTGGTYAGVIQNGGAGSLSLAIGGPAALTLTGANTFSGSTTVNGGDLQVNSTLGSGAIVTVNSSGTLGGSGGTIAGVVTVNSGGTITATAGTGNAPGTLTLSSGLVINSGGIVAFNLVNGGGNDLIKITSGGITLNSGAILQVAPYITIGGTYALMTYTGANPSLGSITEEDLGGGALQSNYSFTAASGTLDLVVTPTPLAVANIAISSPVSGSRVMSGTSLVVSGTVFNSGTFNTLSGTLTSAAGRSFTVVNLNPGVASVNANSSLAFSGSIANTGVTLGNETYGVTVTDGSSINTSATASGTVDVVGNRVVSGSGIPAYGIVHAGTVVSTTITLSSTGADNQYTRVTVADAGPDPFGISITGGNPSGTFNGSFTDTRLISGTFTNSGTDNGITLITTGEGLAGESPNNVNVGFTAVVFSGHASWNNIGGNNSWATNNNWGDTSGGIGTIGAPGLSGGLSVGDTALFTDFSSETSTTTVNLNGANPSLAGVTFSSNNTSYTIAQGSGGSITFQNGATISVTSGTATFGAGVVNGSNTLNVAVGAGDDMIWSGSEPFTGRANITSGTLTMTNPSWLGQNAGTNVYNISSGAVLQWNVIPSGSAELVDAVKNATTVEGSGTLLVTGTGGFYVSNTELSIQMSAGGVIEIANGATLSNGGNGQYGMVWTNNLGSLQLDTGGTINTWNADIPVIVNALNGGGTINRIGFGNGGSQDQVFYGGENFVIGVNNGSGTFSGLITNSLGTQGITKEGTGLEVFTGANSYSGATVVTGGTLRITNGAGLGFGGLTFVSGGNGITGQFTTAVNGGTLDVNNGITLNNAITLSGGSLINSTAGTTSTLGSGIAGITFTNDPSLAAPVTVSINGGSGTVAATAAGGYVSTSSFPNVYGSGGANGTANDYVQVSNAGSGYMASGTGAPTVTVTVNGVSNTGTDLAVVSSLTLINNNNFVGGNGNLTISGQIMGSGGFTTVGSGTLTLANAETFTGGMTLGATTTLDLGAGFSYGGSIAGSGTVALVANSGTEVLYGISTYTGPTTINAGSTLQLGNGTSDGAIVSSTVSNSGAIYFATAGNENLPSVITGNGTVTMAGAGTQEISGNNSYTGVTLVKSGTLQLGSATALGNSSQITVNNGGSLNVSNGLTPQTTTLSGAGQVLTLNNGASLDFGVSNTGNDELVISGGASTSVNGTITINLSLISGTGQGSTPFTIISDASGGLGGATFVLGNLPSLSTGEIVSQTANAVTVLFSGVKTAYWTGNGGNSPGFWDDYSNFSSDPGGTTPLSGSFGVSQDIVFSASGATNQNNSFGNTNLLDTNESAHSLTIADPAGVDIGEFGSNVLTLAGNSGNTGITVTSAAGSALAEIDAGIDLAGTPNITVNNSGGLLITGIISGGTNGLIVNGTGMLTLVGAGYAVADNSYTGGTELISGTLSVNADAAFGATGPGNGVTFNPGAGNSVTLQQAYENPYLANNTTTAPNRTFMFASGTGVIDPGPSGSVFTISGPVLSSGGALQVIDTGELILSGSVAFNSNAYISSGTLDLAFPGTLAQTGSSNYNTAPGGTLMLTVPAAQNLSPAAGDSVAFTGSGTLRLSGGGTLQMHGSTVPGAAYPGNGNIYMDMSGGVIEVAAGIMENGGLGSTSPVEGFSGTNTGSPMWTGTYNGTAFTNLASLQIDSGGEFDTWNGNNPLFDALLGSGTLTRLGYSTTDNDSIVTIGDNNGSGTFSGVITSVYGTLDITKTGTGTEEFSGNNSYSGSTLVNGGILRVASATGLGNGGLIYYLGSTKAPNGSVTVTNSATVDLYNGITVDKAFVLNSGSLVNSGTGTSIVDNGIAALVLGGVQAGTYTTPTITPSGGNGSGATFAAGSGSAPTSGVNSVYGEVTAPGTGYTVAPTLSFTDQGNTGSGVTATAVLSSVTLQGNSNFIGGAGNLTINAQVLGTGGFTTTGTGTVTLTGSNTYSGATTIASSGILVNNGYITGVVNVNPNTGAASTLSGTGVFGGLVSTAATSGLNVAHIAPGVNTSGNFGAAGTLTLKNGLTIGNGTNLDFDLGSSSDLLAVTAGTLSLGSGVTLNVNALGTLSLNTTYTLITYGGALTGASNLSSWTATNAPGGTVNTLFINSGSSITVDFATSAATPTTYSTALTVFAGATRIAVGGTTSITSSISNTGTGSDDSLAYTGLGASATGGSVGGSTTNGTVAIGVTGTNGLTYTAPGSAAVVTISPVVSSATNANIGGNATSTGTTTATITVVNNRVITSTSANLGDTLVGITTGTQISSLSSPGSFSQNTTLTVASGSTASGGVFVGNGSSQTFNGTTTTGAFNVSGNFTTSTAGSITGTVNVATSGEGLNGEVDAPVAVTYTTNVFQAFTGTTPSSTSGTNSAALTLTNLASTDGGQRAGVSLTGFSVGNPNFAITGTGSVGIANGSNVTATVGTVTTAASDLNGSYSYTGSVTGTAQYTDPALALQAGVSNQTWSNVTLNATVTGQTSNARTNVFSAQIQSGSSYAGYSLSSSVMVGGIQQHPNTGSGGTTTATLLAGTASATTTVDMSFDSSPVSGPDDGVFRTSDILTLTGIHSTGTTTIDSLTVTLTDEYVLQLSYDTSAAGLELIGQNTGTMWVNAADLNSSTATEQLYANESYATYVAGTAGGDTPALGAYGYDAGVAWAVLNHTSVSDPVSEFAVIPEPGTYAMIFSGFGMLIGFRRLRRRRSRD